MCACAYAYVYVSEGRRWMVALQENCSEIAHTLKRSVCHFTSYLDVCWATEIHGPTSLELTSRRDFLEAAW